MTRPTKPAKAAQGTTKPWQMFPSDPSAPRRAPSGSTLYAPAPQPPGTAPRETAPAGSEPILGDPASERPAMAAPEVARGD